MTKPTLKTNAPRTPNDVQQCVTTQGVGTTLRKLLIFGIAYALAFKYGSTFSANRAAPLWFPDSVLLCALLLSPRRLWPWYLLVGAPIRLINQTVPVWFLAATYLNDGLKAILSAYLLRLTMRGPVRLNTLRQFEVYLAIAVVGVPVLSAMGGAAIRVQHGDTFWRAFYEWFLGNATAALVLTPTLLYWCLDGWHEVKGRAAMFLPIVLALAACLYFTFLSPHSEYSPLILYAPLPLLILAATTLRPVGISTAISSLALVSILSAVQGRGAFFMVQSQHSVLSMQLFLILISVPMLFVAILLEERKAVETQLSQSQEALRANYRRTQDLAGKVLNAQEEERRRIGRELHDDIEQRLALVTLGLDRLKSELPVGMETESNAANALFADVQTIAADVHEIARQLHPGALQHLGLERALRSLCHNIADQHDIVVEFVSDDVKGLAADVNLCVFRVAQEALSNAVRHGKAKRIDVLLQKGRYLLTLNVSDEGEGFDPTIASGGLGLLSMLERVRFMGGNVLVKSQVGRGTQVDAELPLSKSA